MSAYPSLPTTEAFAHVPRDGRVIDNGADGLARIRKLHDDRVDAFPLVHPALNATQVATLEAHYAANMVAAFTYTSPQDNAVYTVAYAARPTYKLHLPAGILRTATVRLTQVA